MVKRIKGYWWWFAETRVLNEGKRDEELKEVELRWRDGNSRMSRKDHEVIWMKASDVYLCVVRDYRKIHEILSNVYIITRFRWKLNSWPALKFVCIFVVCVFFPRSIKPCSRVVIEWSLLKCDLLRGSISIFYWIIWFLLLNSTDLLCEDVLCIEID